MSKQNYPKFAIIKKGNYGIPYNPSPEATKYLNVSGGKFPFPDTSIKEGQIIEEGKWVFVSQYRYKGTVEWKNVAIDIDLKSVPTPAEPMEEYQTIYQLYDR